MLLIDEQIAIFKDEFGVKKQNERRFLTTLTASGFTNVQAKELLEKLNKDKELSEQVNSGRMTIKQMMESMVDS